MRIIPSAHQALRKLALIGLLLSPFAPSYAAELVGKPVPLGSHTAAVSSAVQTSAQSESLKAQAGSAEHERISAEAAEIPEAPEPPEAPEIASPQDDIHHAMNEMRDNFHQDFDGFDMSPDLLIPIVAISLLFGGPVLLVIILALLHYRAKARRQQNINTNIDKLLAAGRDIPVELLLGEETMAVKRNIGGDVTLYRGDDGNMQKGVRNIGLGTGWLVFLTIMFGIKIGAFGFIFIGLGISQVVIWKLSGTSPVSSNQGFNSSTDAARIQE